MSNGSFRQENVRLNQIRENFLQTKYLKSQNENLLCWELSDGQLRQAKSLSTRIQGFPAFSWISVKQYASGLS